MSPDNSHLKAAIAAGLPSNNSKGIITKGRIVPRLRHISFINNNNDNANFLRDKLTNEQIDHLVLDTFDSLKNWLGEDFSDYTIQYTNNQLSPRPRSGD